MHNQFDCSLSMNKVALTTLRRAARNLSGCGGGERKSFPKVAKAAVKWVPLDEHNERVDEKDLGIEQKMS